MLVAATNGEKDDLPSGIVDVIEDPIIPYAKAVLGKMPEDGYRSPQELKGLTRKSRLFGKTIEGFENLLALF